MRNSTGTTLNPTPTPPCTTINIPDQTIAPTLDRYSPKPWTKVAPAQNKKRGKIAKPKNKKSNKVNDRAFAWVLIDRSGSMAGREQAVIEGVSSFIDDQTSTQGSCKITVAQFDSENPYDVIIDAQSAKKADKGELDRYQPRMMTPLYDAIGKLIADADSRVAQRKKASKKAEDQTVVIVTDGYENASKEFSREDINKLIKERRDKGWAFVFLGANQDSFETGGDMGILKTNTRDYIASDAGIKEAFHATSTAYSLRRQTLSSVGVDMMSPDGFFDTVDDSN